MKTFLIIFMSAFLVATAQMPPKIAEFGEGCQKQLNSSPDDIKVVKEHQVPITRGAKCLMACIQKKLGIQDDSGKFSKQAALDNMKNWNPEMVANATIAFGKCEAEIAAKLGGDECDNAAIIMECLNKYCDKKDFKGPN